MLNINLIKKRSVKKYVEPKTNEMGRVKYFPPATKEWYDSVYNYDKNTTKIMPYTNNFLFKLIKSYFNMFKVYKKKMKRSVLRRLKRKKRLSVRKLFFSKPELRHTNDKIIITIYIYNREYNYLTRKFRKIKPKWLNKYIVTLKKNKIKKGFSLTIKNFKTILTYLKKFGIKNEKNTILRNLLKRALKKEILFLKLKKRIAFNKSKFKGGYLLGITNLVEKIYKKKIQLNLVTIKNFYLNSDILSQIVLSKLKNWKNKGRALRILENSIYKVKIPLWLKKTIKRGILVNKFVGLQNLAINNFIDSSSKLSINKDSIDEIIKQKYLKGNIRDLVLKSTKHKILNGVRLEASGRLTRRLIAQRAIQKSKHIGTLKNVNSSYNKFSSVILRGNKKSNVQYTFLSSKTRIGAFGLKGWVSAC